MAFSTLGWINGLPLSTCDSTTGWSEVGGGTISANSDFYLQGSASIGSQYASKSGYTIYTHGSTYDLTTTYANHKLYMWVGIQSTSALETMANDGLSIAVGDASGSMDHWSIAGSDNDNGWSSGWKMFVLNPNTTPTTSNSADLTAADTFGLWIETSSSVRAESIFIDEFVLAEGFEVHSGTGTFDDVLNYTWRNLGTRVIGSFTESGRFVFALDNFTVGNSTDATADTTINITDKVIGYTESEYYSGSAWVSSVETNNAKLYNVVHLDKHSSYATTFNSNNSSWFGSTDAWLSFTKDSGASYNFDGGTIEKVKAITFDSDDSVQSMVINDCESITVNGATFDSNTIQASSPLIVQSTVTNCNIVNHTGNGVTTSVLGSLDGCYFERGSAGYAVDIGNITTTQSLDWKNTESGYTSGTSGTNVGVTPTGAETILCNVSSGEVLTISVATGASTPSVANSGSGTVNVEAGLLPITITVKDKTTGLPIAGANVMVKRDDTKATIISGTTNASGIYSESVASSYNGVAFVSWARESSLTGTDYETGETSGTISTSGASINFSLDPMAN